MTVHVLLSADNHLDPSAVQYGPRRFERKRDFQHCFDVLVNFALDNRPDLFLIGGDFYDGILPGNPTRAYVAEQFKRLHEKEVKTVLVSGHHDTPRSIEQGVSPLSVHAKSGHAYFLQEPQPTPKLFHLGSETVNIIGMSLNPGLAPDQDPLAGQKIDHAGDVNIFLTHYPIEGFEGYFGQETHIGKSSIPRDFQLFASGHLHRQQKNTINGTPVIYPGSTERASFNEEGEEKGFYWLELDKTGILHQEFHSTPARPMETLDSRVTGEGGSLTRQLQDALGKRTGLDKILPGSFLPRRVRRRRPQSPDNGPVRVASENLARRGTGPDIPEPPHQGQGGRASSRTRGVEGDGRKVEGGGSQLKLVSLQAQY